MKCIDLLYQTFLSGPWARNCYIAYVAVNWSILSVLKQVRCSYYHLRRHEKLNKPCPNCSSNSAHGAWHRDALTTMMLVFKHKNIYKFLNLKKKQPLNINIILYSKQ